MNKKPLVSVLFVCLGNICRSPTAEAVFRHKAKNANIVVNIDSAGTIDYHQGAMPDHRTMTAGSKRGYSFEGLYSRPVVPEDFEQFDYVLAMDKSNLSNLQALCPPHLHHKLQLFLEFCDHEYTEVPDPYNSGPEGFELVLDLIESASNGLLKHLGKRESLGE